MSKWQTWLCEKCGVSHAMNETKCFHCSHPKPTTPPGEQQGFPPRFFAASDNFDKEGKPYTEQIRVWPEYSGAYPEFYTEFMSKDTHTALLAEAVREARAENEALMLALKTECERSGIFRKGLEKLQDGPGRNMAGWKQTWAHEYAGEMIAKGAAISPKAKSASTEGGKGGAALRSTPVKEEDKP